MKPRLTPITRICQWPPCSQTFVIVPVRTRDIFREFCSTSCRAKNAKSTQDATPLADRFWAKVAKAGPNECWLWTGAKAGKGYGTIYVLEQRRNVGAHVVSWYLFHSTWPPEGMDVLHNCPGEIGDQPACCNPAHLWLGTHQANMLDKIAKGRDNTPRKITKTQALEMCALYATGEWTYKQLAERYSVKEGTPFWIIKKYGDPAMIPGRRERAARGERSGNAKLTDAQWQEALALHATGEWPSRRLAARYGVDKSSILRRLKHQL